MKCNGRSCRKPPPRARPQTIVSVAARPFGGQLSWSLRAWLHDWDYPGFVLTPVTAMNEVIWCCHVHPG
ncbi:hypothetical protein Y032_0034g2948 [Ancylostoma ceylanicum]|uniref:Uncharacterized protein n=1 Tax=Ancylostoma ceylanicum TaxID=53326 RepID=A0A016ULS4_9BILA|nr:hypothetical protein Y032_0034g2948 [Ancylostoma ceylanicum]